ncbi:MAG: hypothetical protein AMXMBFR33_66210 [Candidatus Xenobia bacterium]
MAILPPQVRQALNRMEDEQLDLIEVVLDLGRRAEARFPGKFVFLTADPVSREDIEYVTTRIGTFGKDNRAGIERTLHRISAIRNRVGGVVGLTCRVGRAVYGTVSIIRDVVESGQNLLLLGRPGVGKTTMLREIARVLAEDFSKRVVIVDTSNEIAGDGDIPHPGIGPARRMQVPQHDEQHAVMIEAVENHMPQVIVVDEIGTEAEAYAARTIAERGVQLVATAHGNTLENLLMNPTLSDLVGGIQVVTLSDEEARRRKTQKSVQERKAPPTFDVVIEIQAQDAVALHLEVASVVDRLLRGYLPSPELRQRDPEGTVIVLEPSAAEEEEQLIEEIPSRPYLAPPPPGHETLENVRIYPYAVSRNRLERAIKVMGLSAQIVRTLDQADLVLTIKGQDRRRLAEAPRVRERNLPVHVLKSNTTSQIQDFLARYFKISDSKTEELALKEAEEAVRRVVRSGRPADLAPQRSTIRQLQHELAERYKVRSRSFGTEPLRYVRIYK